MARILKFIVLLALFFLLSPRKAVAQTSEGNFNCAWNNSANACQVSTTSCDFNLGKIADPIFCDQFKNPSDCNGKVGQCITSSLPTACSGFSRSPSGTLTPQTQISLTASGCATSGVTYSADVTRLFGATQSVNLSQSGSVTSQYSATIGTLPVGSYSVALMGNGTPAGKIIEFDVASSVPPGGDPPGDDDSDPGTPTGGTAGQLKGLCPNNHISTAIGCIPLTDVNGMTTFFLRFAIGIAGGIALLLIGFAAYRIITSQGDPRRLQGGQELLLSAIGGLIMVVLSIYLLRFIGVNLLGLF